MEKKQTAVQWLLEELRKPYVDKYIADISNKALQMEREQIEEAYRAALPLNINHDYMSEKYYTETFKL